MPNGVVSKLNKVWRSVLVLTLFSHLMATFGFPMTASSHNPHDASQSFPCQNRPCGCATANLCWQGDCCCFTLEEKLAWADTQGIEPPKHVRPLVESRKARPAPPKAMPCCSEAETTPKLASACLAESAADIPHCATEFLSKREKPANDSAGVRWVVSVFSQKCRGDGPAALFQAEPRLPSDLPASLVLSPIAGEFLTNFDCHAITTIQPPPTPPPQQI